MLLPRPRSRPNERRKLTLDLDEKPGDPQIIVVMKHTAKDGTPKFIPTCTLPLTGRKSVDMIVTDLAVFRRDDHQARFRLVEMASGVDREEIAAKTGAAYEPM